MANTYFGFDASFNNGDLLLPPDDDEECLENEDEYDALNDETFGGLEDSEELDDWEHQHEQFAEITEHSRHPDSVENSFQDLILGNQSNVSGRSLEPLSLSNNSVWSYTPPAPNQNGQVSILSSLQQASRSFIQSHVDPSNPRSNDPEKAFNNALLSSTPVPPSLFPRDVVKKICTVEELEKNLKSSAAKQYAVQAQQQKQQHSQQPPIGPPGSYPHPRGPPMVPNQPIPPGPPFHPMFQQHHMVPNRMQPPGFPPFPAPPPGMRHMRPGMPPGFHMMPPHPMFHQSNTNGCWPPMPPGMNFPPSPMNPMMNYQHPQRIMQNHQNPIMNRNNPNQQHQHNGRMRHDSGQFSRNEYPDRIRDEYDGLMTQREKQWLLNIQLLQLNTGTPYFDDYYYTMFKERKARSNREMNLPVDRNKFQNNRQRKNSDRQDNPLTPRVYTPLQFENSLGKLQCGSVTAPRKIIDTDVVTYEKDSENVQTSRDTRRTKQILLELEALYTMLLKAEDLTNSMAINNLKTLRDIKQKQRLRELDLATTSEQKQEIIELFKKESEPVVENQNDYLSKVMAVFLQEDKFTNFMNVRKGKMFLLRLLPHVVKSDVFSYQLPDIWNKVLLSLPIVGRRDMAGDNILPKLYPFFKRYVQTVTMSDILEVVSGIIDSTKQENSRSTPLSHQGKCPLYFILLNKFGVSVLAVLFIRTEFLISSNICSENEQNVWFNFVSIWSDLMGQVNKVSTPLEAIPKQIFTKHCGRIPDLSTEKQILLSKYFVQDS